jgi:hypothetical protein
MSQINFLPQAFVAQRDRRYRLARASCLIAIALTLIAGWLVMSLHNLRRLGEEADRAEQFALSVAGQMVQLQRLRQRENELLKVMRIEQEVRPTLEVSALLALITDLAPRDVAVQSISLESQIDLPAAQAANAPPRGRSAGKPKQFGDGWQRFQLQVEGVAPDDNQVADFVSRLSTHPVFENVTIRYSRSGEVGPYRARQFRIDFDVRLTREYHVSPRVVMGMGREQQNSRATEQQIGTIRNTFGHDRSDLLFCCSDALLFLPPEVRR